MMAQFPSKEIARRSYDYRTLGLGYANIGGLLMSLGYPYDSDKGRSLCGAISALMTGVSYATSSEMAKELGPGKNIVTILCDKSDRYHSKIFNKKFLLEKKLPTPNWL